MSNPASIRLSINIVLALVFVTSGESHAQSWTKKAQMKAEISLVTFPSRSLGFVGLGLGEGGKLGTCGIYKTTDGGDTWLEAQIPPNYSGAVTGIWMWNERSGVASVQPWRCSGDRGVWRTDDGGMTWVETDLVGACTSIWQTSKALIATDILGLGHISLDSGQTWTGTFISSTNDVVFVDDSHGLITDFRGQNWLVSSDGGVSWNPAGSTVESWSAYPVAGTSTYYAAPEGPSDGSFYHTEIMRSDDYGMTWRTVAKLPFRTAGHIAGVGDDALYVQTNWAANGDNGHITNLWRSTDKGVTWVNINGPGTWGDTRFTVWNDGCLGTIIWAFDSTGGLYKLEDAAHSYTGEVAYGPNPKTYHVPLLSSVAVAIEVGVPPTRLLDTMTISQIDIRIKYNSDVIDLNPSKLSALIQPPSGWTVQNPSASNGILKYTLINSSNAKLTNDMILGDIVFTTFPSTASSSLVELDGFSIKTSSNLYRYCMTVEGDYLANVKIDQSGVETQTSKLDLSAYPNPIHVGQTLEVGMASELGIVRQVQLVDLLGRVVFSSSESELGSSSNGRLHVTLPEDLVSGSYYLRFEGSAGAKTAKISVISKY